MMPNTADDVERNLAVVDQHIKGEARDVDSILGLYTDDCVLEVPGRGLRFEGRAAIRANYVAMWPSMAEVELLPLERFATAERVVDDMIVRTRLVGDGMVNAPLPKGSKVEIRLVHHFSMRNGLIAREQVFEIWRLLDDPSADEPSRSTLLYSGDGSARPDRAGATPPASSA